MKIAVPDSKVNARNMTFPTLQTPGQHPTGQDQHTHALRDPSQTPEGELSGDDLQQSTHGAGEYAVEVAADDHLGEEAGIQRPTEQLREAERRGRDTVEQCDLGE